MLALPSGVVTSTVAAPTGLGGAGNCTRVAERAEKVAGTPPTVTAVVPSRLVPSSVMVLRPEAGVATGEIAVIVGSSGAGLTVRLSDRDTPSPAPSITCSVTLAVPSALGVPVIASPTTDRPAGRPVAEKA